MLKPLATQAELFAAALIGAALGILLTRIGEDFVTTLLFTGSLFVLLLTKSLLTHLLTLDEERTLEAFIVFIIFIVFWVLATGSFGNLWFWEENWSRDSIHREFTFILVLVFLITLFTLILGIATKLRSRLSAT